MDLKSSLLEAFLKYVLPTLATALAALLTALLAAATRKFTADAAAAKAAGKSNLIQLEVARAFHFADVVTHELEVTLKEEYEKASADGVITAEEGKALKDKAISRVLELLGTEGKSALIDALGIASGALPQYLGGLVELAVKKLDTKVTVAAELPSKASGAVAVAVEAPGGLPSPR
jgi:hypothetical protein